MSTIEKLVENGVKVKEIMALRTYPLGIKFYKELKEAEEMLKRSRKPLKDFNARMPFCQVVNISRTYGWVLGVTMDDMYCLAGAAAMGLLDEIPDFLAREMRSWHSKSEEAGKVIWESVKEKFLPQKTTQAILIAPLRRISFEPDVIVMYGSPTQVARMAKAFTWHGILPEFRFSGVISCSAISNAYLTGKPQVSIPCAGEVFLGRSEEDEVGLMFPAKLIDNLVSGLEGIKFMFPYPPAKFMLYEPRVPEGYKITYKDYLEWKKSKKES
ncbi:MAG: DUF169 domain-containing protein [Candidatus Bathyarchaeota archaeon]